MKRRKNFSANKRRASNFFHRARQQKRRIKKTNRGRVRKNRANQNQKN